MPIKSSRKRQSPEEDLQMAVVKFLTHALGKDSMFFHPANGGYRHFTEARRLKGMGVVPGMPDLCVINGGRLIGIELKSDIGRVSDVQAYCHDRLRRAGVPVAVCRSLDEVVAALVTAGVALQARVAA